MPSLFPKTHLIWFPLIASVNDGAVRACVMQDAAQVGDKDPKARLVHQGCSTPLGSGRDELFFFFSQHPLDVFSTCRMHACGQFATQTRKKCPGGNWAPLLKDLAVPAVLWAQRGRGSSWMARSIAAQRGQNFLTAVINNSSTHLCEIQFSFLHLHHSTEDMAFVAQIHHVSQGGEEGKKGVLSLRSGSKKKGRKKAMERDVHNPPAKGNLWVHTARTAPQWAQV